MQGLEVLIATALLSCTERRRLPPLKVRFGR